MNLELEHIKNGDKKVFQKLFDRYYSGMVELAYRFIYDQAVCEDLVQDIFIDLWENASSYRIEKSLKGYLFTSVRNRCLNYLKSIEITEKHYLLDISISLSSDESYDVFDEEEEELMRKKAEIILESLPEKMRLVFRLKVLEGYTYAQIAEETGVSINTVKTQLKRARSRITEFRELIVLFWGKA